MSSDGMIGRLLSNLRNGRSKRSPRAVISKISFFICVVFLMTLVSCARQFYSGTRINSVRSVTYNRGVVSIAISQLSKVFWTEGRVGNRFFIDLHDCQVSFKGARNVRDQFIQEYHWAQYDPRTVRVVITPNSNQKIKIQRAGDRILLLIPGARPWREGKRNFVILIDPGHGGKDPGSIGALGTKEKDVNLDIALKLADLYARQPYIKVYLTRKTDMTLGLEDRRQMSRNVHPDLFISIHLNSNSDKRKNQTEAYYYDSSSAGLAELLADAMTKSLYLKRKVVKRKNLHVLKDNYAHYSILVEPVYLSNLAVESSLKFPWYRHQIAQTIHSVLTKFINAY